MPITSEQVVNVSIREGESVAESIDFTPSSNVGRLELGLQTDKSSEFGLFNRTEVIVAAIVVAQ